MYSYGPPHMAGQKQDDQHEHTFSSYVRIWNVALKTCQRRWTIGKIGERGSGISVLVARHDEHFEVVFLLKYIEVNQKYLVSDYFLKGNQDYFIYFYVPEHLSWEKGVHATTERYKPKLYHNSFNYLYLILFKFQLLIKLLY